MNQLNITAVPKAPQDTPVQDAIMCGVLAAGLYLLVATTGCGVSTPGGYVAGSTSYLAEYNQGGFMPAARKEVQ